MILTVINKIGFRLYLIFLIFLCSCKPQERIAKDDPSCGLIVSTFHVEGDQKTDFIIEGKNWIPCAVVEYLIRTDTSQKFVFNHKSKPPRINFSITNCHDTIYAKKLLLNAILDSFKINISPLTLVKEVFSIEVVDATKLKKSNKHSEEVLHEFQHDKNGTELISTLEFHNTRFQTLISYINHELGPDAIIDCSNPPTGAFDFNLNVGLYEKNGLSFFKQYLFNNFGINLNYVEQREESVYELIHF